MPDWPVHQAGGQRVGHQGSVITFDFSPQVSFTARRPGVLATLLPGHRIAALPLSFRGAFPAATMPTTITR